MEEKKGGRAVKEKNEGGELCLWPNVLFHPRILWGPLRPHMVAHECTSACAKIHTHLHTDSFNWWRAFGLLISLALSVFSAALFLFHLGLFSACACRLEGITQDVNAPMPLHTHESIQIATFHATGIALEPGVRCFTAGWWAKRKEWNQEPIFFYSFRFSNLAPVRING